MKRLFTILIILSVISSCSLDEKPYNITSEELSSTEKGAEQLVTGIYSTFWSSYMMKKTYMEWIDMDHDHAGAQSWVMSGAGEGDVTTHWGYNGSSDLWNVFYLMISRCNKAKEEIENSNKLDGNKKFMQLYGEALFLRAFAYYHLVRMYGPVPLRLTYIQENDKERASVPDVFKQIEDDLICAIENLSYKSEGVVGEWGHADKTAAQLLLAKVYCTMGSASKAANGCNIIVCVNGTDKNYTCSASATDNYKTIDAAECYKKAKDITDIILSNKGKDFDLKNSFTDVWGGNNARNNEFVWGIASNSNLDFHTSHLHYYYSLPPFGGNAWVFMSPELYKQYESTDERMIYGVFHYFASSYENVFKYGWCPYPNSDEYPYEKMPDNFKAHTTKWYGNFWRASPGVAKWYTGDLKNIEPKKALDGQTVQEDVILLRFAEVYLLKAEAEIELGNIKDGIIAMNAIRKRAKASEYPLTLNQLEARSNVLKERALEFCQEFNRKFDLLRWGLYLDVMNDTKSVLAYGSNNSKIRESKCLLYAVPRAEISENKLFGPNNPGW